MHGGRSLFFATHSPHISTCISLIFAFPPDRSYQTLREAPENCLVFLPTSLRRGRRVLGKIREPRRHIDPCPPTRRYLTRSHSCCAAGRKGTAKRYWDSRCSPMTSFAPLPGAICGTSTMAIPCRPPDS